MSGTTASPDTQAPTVPTGLAVTTVTASSVTLSWNASADLPNPGGTGVGGYYVYRNGNVTTPVATVTSATTFTDSGLASGTTNTYQVAAFDRATPPNVSVPSSAVSGTTSAPDTEPPTVPTNLAIANVTAASITLTWSPSTDLPNPGGTGVGGYYIYRNGNITTPMATVTSGTSFTDSGLAPNSSYNYQVAAFDNATPPNVSAPSNAIGATTAGVIGASQITQLSVNNAGTTYVVCGGGSACSQGFLAGATPYVDNAAILINAPVPGPLLGQTFIQTAQADAAAAPDSPNFLSFTLGQSAAVYVAHDVQSAPPPAWLTSGFLDTGLSITNNHGTAGSTLEIYSNIYPSGAQVALGSNSTSGAASGDMYSVIVAPTPSNTIAPNAPANLSPIPNCQTAAVVGFTWDAATVNSGGVALAGYRIVRDGTLLATVSYAQTSYQDTSVLQLSTYGYTVTAFDQAGNISPAASLSVTTNAISATGDAPYCPSGLIISMSFDFLNGYSETNGNGNSDPTNLNDRPPYTDGSDLWPVTQAADGSVYAVFGDGWGLCGMADTGSSENQDYTSFGVSRMTARRVAAAVLLEQRIFTAATAQPGPMAVTRPVAPASMA